jgi:hypothetical protein
MNIAVNTTKGSLFRLNARAYGRMMALGTKVKPHSHDDGSSEPGEIVIFDCVDPSEPVPIVSDNPDDITDERGWIHTDARYYDVVIADEQWTRTDPNLVRVVQELGEHAGQMGCIPTVIDIPDDSEWLLGTFSGWEVVSIMKDDCWHVVWTGADGYV